MNFLIKFGEWFMSFFKSNRAILQLAIQAAAGEYFKKHPHAKKYIAFMSKDISTQISLGDILTLDKAFDQMRERVDATEMNPAEKALFYMLMEQIKVKVNEFNTKEKITIPSQQIGILVDILRWLEEASKF